MRLEFVNLDYAKEVYKKYFDELEYGIDGYYETRIINSKHYSIIDTDVVGICSIDDENWLTALYVFPENRERYENIFGFIVECSFVKKILFTTKDLLFTSIVKKNKYVLEDQAYNFIMKKSIKTNYEMEYAKIADVETISNTFGDFVKDYKQKIKDNQLFVRYERGQLVSLGFYDPFKIYEKRACIAMKVVESERRKGHGVKVLEFLIQHLQSNNIFVNARCWIKNEASRKTLLKTGFEPTNKLMRIESLFTEK